MENKRSGRLSDHAELARALLPHVLVAGKAVMTHFREGCEVFAKSGGSPVTQADRDGEDILLAALAKIAPGVSVIAEEMAAGGLPGEIADEFFLVDALDGTREFTNGRPEFTLNVGLIRERKPVFGVIFAPALSRLFITLSGDHAIVADLSPDAPEVRLEALDAKRLSVRSLGEGERLVVTASRSHGSEALETWLADKAVGKRTNIGSSLKFCQVAEGISHVYPRFGSTMEWDTSAGHAILLAAGGVVTDVHGVPLSYGKAQAGFLNPHFIASAALRPEFYV
jgi:3'(2'), 5'-bisphosphate nucleotidase